MPTTQPTEHDKPPVIRIRTARPTQRLLTLRQASEITGIPERTLHFLVTKGVLAVVRFPESRRIWIDRVDLDVMLAASKEKRTA
jgi:predicted DNA-binding transcriptional regulator AlpA